MGMSLAEFRELGLAFTGRGLQCSVAGQGKRAVPGAARSALPEDRLWSMVSARFPMAEREYRGAVPGRRFRVDIALPALRIAIECDGWTHHGTYRQAHRADRERQNLLVLHGWRVLRFTTSQIQHDEVGILESIDRLVQQSQQEAA
jgi:very-short-patch-repair endonuclease